MFSSTRNSPLGLRGSFAFGLSLIADGVIKLLTLGFLEVRHPFLPSRVAARLAGFKPVDSNFEVARRRAYFGNIEYILMGLAQILDGATRYSLSGLSMENMR
jgi:hypothetical protein